MSTTLGDDMPKEQQRVRELLGEYKAIGPSGRFGAIVIEATLREADQAVMSGDVVRMIAAYQALKGCE